MRKILLAGLLTFAFHLCAADALAQGGSRGPDASVLIDMELEAEAKHNLEVARHYFKMKKAYRASLTRAEEIVAGYPKFSRMDEALYIVGMSNLYLAQGKGKQKSDAPAGKLREEARLYLSRLVREFPESDYRERADDALKTLGGPKTEDAKAKKEN